ncbi:hypothetical protein IAR55_002904 [Kwoniella newhampshirensis]|uniref:HECT-type E3 ubiquitin transferase n=1 Tax=Kwoniella newhampshirensis TaxID=1651941 RepID=A0AAW0Z004_9TREE
MNDDTNQHLSHHLSSSATQHEQATNTNSNVTASETYHQQSDIILGSAASTNQDNTSRRGRQGKRQAEQTYDTSVPESTPAHLASITRRSTRLSIANSVVDTNSPSSTSGNERKKVLSEAGPTDSTSSKSPIARGSTLLTMEMTHLTNRLRHLQLSRARNPSSTPINPPSHITDNLVADSDRKGKKRAARSPTPPPSEPIPSTAEVPPPSKRAKRSSATSTTGRYDLRHKSENRAQPDGAAANYSKGRGKAGALELGDPVIEKKMPKKANPRQKRTGPSGSSSDRTKKGDTAARHLVGNELDDESLWIDESSSSAHRAALLDDEDDDENMEGSEHDENGDEDVEEDDDDEEDGDEDGEENTGPGFRGSGGAGGNAYDRLARLATESGLNMDEATAAALFGPGFRAFGGIMSGLSNRFKRLKNNLQSKNIGTRLGALRECSELLLVSNEDTLGGTFSPTSFATEFVAILNGKPNINNEAECEDEKPGMDEMDEDAQLAAALALSSGGAMPVLGGGGGEDDMECQLLACRCLAHLMEALPGSGHTLVHLGAVPVLCSKLTEISYIELAEQTLSTLEKISAEYPAAIAREGGLGALLGYLPFFSTNVQRTAVTAAANCCRNISSEHYNQVKEVFPILRDTLSSGDQRLVEQATLAVVRTIEAYRHNAEHLEGLLDVPTVTAVNALLMPSGGSPLLSPSTYTHLLKALTTSARGSPKVSIAFLEAGMTTTIYQILTGVLPPSHDEDEQGNSSGGQGLAGGVADMAVLQNLAHRPKDQVEEALALICELLPPAPRDGVFDSKGYTEKSLAKARKGRKSDRSERPEKPTRRSSRVADVTASPGDSTGPSTPPVGGNATLSTVGDPTTPTAGSSLSRETTISKVRNNVEVQTEQRLELLKSNPILTGRFIKAVVPVLVDVHAASVMSRVRTKVLTGLVKAIAFAEPAELRATLKSVPMASFLCAIISARDNPIFVLHALQIVELLATKLPDVYQASFLREGVVFEIDALADTETSKEKASREAAAVKTEPEEATTPTAEPSSNALAPMVSEDLKPLLAISGLPSALALLAESSSNPSTPKKSSSSSFLDPNDANIIRARMLKAKKVFEAGGDHKHAASKVLDDIALLVQKLCRSESSEAELRDTLRAIASQFCSADQALSSFELLKSGLVDGFLDFVDVDGDVSSSDRRAMLSEIFSDTTLSNPSPLTMLVKRLHESLGRLENFEVETAFGGGSDPARPSASSLSRTMRIRLQADDGEDVPKHVSTLTVTIQAIAPMQALHDYLRPRVADANYGNGLSRMFAAYAAGMPGRGPSGSGTSRLLDALASASGSASRPVAAASDPRLTLGAPVTTGKSEEVPQRGGTAESATGTSKSPKVQRRRSARLSAQGVTAGGESGAAVPAPQASSPTTATAAMSSSAPEPTILPDLPMDMDFDDDYSEEDYDAEVFDEDMDEEIARPTERVVNMSVAPDGSRLEAKTPEGTRVATPQQNPLSSAAAGISGGGLTTPRTASYAGAVKTAPVDWHLEFFINGNAVSLEDTIYGAVHKNQDTIHSGNSYGGVFNLPVTIKFKKVDGPGGDKPPVEALSPASVTSTFPAGLEPGTPTSKILRLLRVVHNLSVEGRETVGAIGTADTQLDEKLFVNNKLTAKLTRQLEETMIVASNCLPEWAVELPKHFSFLFPFDTRYSFLQSTSFGYGRLISRSQSGQSSRNNSRRDDVSHLARLVRQKVRISRSQLLESCAKVLELYGTSSGILEVEYFDEIGTGLGPTLEFYSLASKEFAKRALMLWRDEDESKEGIYVYHPRGLFPSPLIGEDSANGTRLSWYKTLGLFTGRALLDSRIIDVNLNKVFLKLILGKPVKKNISTLKAVDSTLARSLERLQAYLYARREIEALMLPASSRRNKLAALTVGGAKLADLSLDFTLPGYDIELKQRGAHIDVDDSNLEEYLEKVLDFTLGSGVAAQVKAFQEGFSMIFSIRDMQIFSPEELGLLFGNAEEDWSRETLEQALKADHGYNLDSRAVQNLIDVMVSYDKDERRQFLQFITGAPKLPIGGFRGLTPPFTVVRKPHEPPFRADDYLPSVMTCAQYLKMPDYSTKEILAAQIQRAMRDGGGSFHLS